MNKEQVAAWKNWQQNPCWKELVNMIDEIKKDSVKDEDRVPTPELSIAVVGECRGVRKGLDKLLRQVEDIKTREQI